MLRRYLLIIGIIGLVLAGVIIIGTRLGLASPRLVDRSGQPNNMTGSRGPVYLAFMQPMDEASVEERLRFVPPISGKVDWLELPAANGQSLHVLRFIPDSVMPAGELLQAHIDPGALSLDGRQLLQEVNLSVQVRTSEVVYLTPIGKGYDVLAVDSAGKSVRPLTSTAGRVTDFTISTDGENLLYALQNGTGGMDIWRTDRLGQKSNLVTSCQTMICDGLAYQPYSDIAVFQKRSGNLAPQLWLLDTLSGKTDPLFLDRNAAAYNPVWSPDGKTIAWYDPAQHGIRVLNFASREEFSLSTSVEAAGTWFPDSQRMLYAEYQVVDLRPYSSVYEVNFATKQTIRRLGDSLDTIDYSLPAIAPDGEWVAVGVRPATSSATRQLWLMRLDGSQRKPITTDQRFHHSGYQWSPDGRWLVYQRLLSGSSQAVPQVMIWSRADGDGYLLAEKGVRPAWLP